MSDPGVDHPEEQTEAEITLIGRGIAVSSRVEFVQGDVVVVRPSVGEFVEQVVVKPGDVVEVFWKNADGQRALPAEVTDVEQGCRHPLAHAGHRAGRAQPAPQGGPRPRGRARRRRSTSASTSRATTVDLCEAGLRANFDGYGDPAGAPATGSTW